MDKSDTLSFPHLKLAMACMTVAMATDYLVVTSSDLAKPHPKNNH